MKSRKPRNSERRKKSPARVLTRKTLILYVVIVCGASLLFGAAWVVFKRGFEQSVFFKIDNVDIQGCNYVSSKEVLALTGLDVKSSMWEIRTVELAERLEKQDWIEEARIDKDWPNRVRIIIKERVPRALLVRKGKLFYLDGEGVVFAPVLPDNDIDFPVITLDEKIQKEESLTGHLIDSALDFLHRASEGNPDLPKQNISEIHIGSKGLILFLVDYPFPVYLGEDNMYRKYRRLSKVLSWLYNRQKIAETEYIDMNYPTAATDDRKQSGKDVMVVFKET